MKAKKRWWSMKVWYLIPLTVFCLTLYLIYGKNPKPQSRISPRINLDLQPISTSTVKEKIAIISIAGIIDSKMADVTAAKLREATTNPDIKAVLLKVESPGGGTNASNLIWNEVMKVKVSSKPVVAFFNGLAASGGYYLSAPADKIIATQETITGSIGVIWQSPNYAELLKKLGVKMTTIKSGPEKDLLSPYRPMTPKDEKIMQTLINEAYDNFVKIVAAGRKMDETKVRKLADGRIYSASQAKKNGLIDEIGYFEDAIKLTQKLSGFKNAAPVGIEEKMPAFIFGFNRFKSNQEKNGSPIMRILKQLMPETGFYYLDPRLLLMYEANHRN